MSRSSPVSLTDNQTTEGSPCVFPEGGKGGGRGFLKGCSGCGRKCTPGVRHAGDGTGSPGSGKRHLRPGRQGLDFAAPWWLVACPGKRPGPAAPVAQRKRQRSRSPTRKSQLPGQTQRWRVPGPCPSSRRAAPTSWPAARDHGHSPAPTREGPGLGGPFRGILECCLGEAETRRAVTCLGKHQALRKSPW